MFYAVSPVVYLQVVEFEYGSIQNPELQSAFSSDPVPHWHPDLWFYWDKKKILWLKNKKKFGKKWNVKIPWIGSVTSTVIYVPCIPKIGAL